MKALSLQQPWGTLIATGEKCIETRNWHPKDHPGIIAIATSKAATPPSVKALCREEPFCTALAGADLPRGSFVAVARLHHCARTEAVQLDRLANENEGAFGNFEAGRWAWFLTDVVPLTEPERIPPDPVGPDGKKRKIFKLGLWTIPEKWLTGHLAQAVEACRAGA